MVELIYIPTNSVGGFPEKLISASEEMVGSSVTSALSSQSRFLEMLPTKSLPHLLSTTLGSLLSLRYPLGDAKAQLV